MGFDWAPLYGEDIGSAIQVAKKSIAKIETNKFSKDDLVELKDALVEIITVIEKNED